jgi:hypothetical protein
MSVRMTLLDDPTLGGLLGRDWKRAPFVARLTHYPVIVKSNNFVAFPERDRWLGVNKRYEAVIGS